jgi:signal transduction histidine kinase
LCPPQCWYGMQTDADTQISELKRKLLLKTAELDSALASISDLTMKLKNSASNLQNAEDALVASDAAGAVRDTQLKTTEDALVASDAALAMKTTELVKAIENLAAANEQLRQSRDLQNAFIKIAAHELKNPIQPLLSIADYLDSLDDTGDGTDKIAISKSDVEMIVRNAKRLERLANDILDVSRIESKSLRLKKEMFDLNQEIRDVVRDFQIYEKEGVQTAFKPSQLSDKIVINADKSRIYEVISNILGNATKFTEHGSITIISAVGKDGSVIVRIKDTGQGISPELLPHLFTKFGVADASDARSGSGLGLFISKGIIDAHGGKLWAENNKDGKGATFTFTVPAS